MNNMDFIQKLSEAFGVSGKEDEVRELILSEISGVCDSVQVDSIGNIIAKKKGEGDKNILLTAPMDEVGFIISSIKKGGGAFLGFEPVGKIRSQSVISEAVVVGDKKLSGVISLKAVHLTTKADREKPAALSDLFIDVGADKKSDVEKSVMIGDYAGFKSRFTAIGESCLCNKAIGLRACCGILTELLKSDLKQNVTCVFTAQRQVGARGAKLNLDIDEADYSCAIVLDTIENSEIKPGCGAAVPLMVNETIPDKCLVQSISGAGGKVKMVGKKAEDGDIGAVSIKGKGIVSAEIDLPVLNKNTSSEIVDKKDIKEVYDLILKYINK